MIKIKKKMRRSNLFLKAVFRAIFRRETLDQRLRLHQRILTNHHQVELPEWLIIPTLKIDEPTITTTSGPLESTASGSL